VVVFARVLPPDSRLAPVFIGYSRYARVIGEVRTWRITGTAVEEHTRKKGPRMDATGEKRTERNADTSQKERFYAIL